jgi:hypothetical protein
MLRDQFGGNVFNVAMRSASGFVGPQVTLINPTNGDADLVTLQINNTGVTGFFIVQDPLGAVTQEAGTPGTFALGQNYPNPFNPTTNIHFDLASGENTRLEVIDVMGRVIATLVNDKMAAGSYSATWDGKDQNGTEVGSGVYFYRLSAGNFVEMKQMTMMK